MAGRLAVDFGTSNTVVAVWDQDGGGERLLHIPGYGRAYIQGGEDISVIPSLVHYAPDGRRWVGSQVLDKSLTRLPGTFRWMKRYILNRSPLVTQVNGQAITPRIAGRDFLSSVLLFASQAVNLQDEEVAFTVPVESFEHYENWLAEVAGAAGYARFRLIDEPSAAALGYGIAIRPGDTYLVFDFGGGTLDIAVILIEPQEASANGRRCRVLGKAGTDLGGITIDGWLFQEVLRQNGRHDSDEDVRQASAALLLACERVKETLSYQDAAEVNLELSNGDRLQAGFTQASFEALLDRYEAFTTIDRTLRRALNAALERGYREDDFKAVLMVGGSSQMPPVQRVLRRIFGKERVQLNRPLDAVARGAAAFIAGVDFYDHIQHDYAIRTIDRQTSGYNYRMIVPHGTPYPTPQPVARLNVRATYSGQTHLGIAIFELGERPALPSSPVLELVFDPGGAARIARLTPQESEDRARFWMNEHNPTFLVADPPAAPGEACFEVSFTVDENKRLRVTARNLINGQVALQDYPVVKLT